MLLGGKMDKTAWIYRVFTLWDTALRINSEAMTKTTSTYLVSKAIAGIPVKVSLDAAGGTCPISELTLEIGHMFGGLPVPVRDGFTFGGWYHGDTYVRPEYVVTGDVKVLVAKWTTEEDGDGL